MKVNKETIKRRSGYSLFWAWHLIYTVLMVALIIPELIWPLLLSVTSSSAPWHYIIYVIILLLLPLVSIVFGITIFRGNFRNLLKYFYGFEMPLLFFVLLRMMTFRDANTGIDWLIINIAIALAAWFTLLYFQNKNNKLLVLENNLLAIIGSTIIAIVGLYFGIALLILMIPLVVEFIKDIYTLALRVDLRDIFEFFINPIMWLGVSFILFTMTLFFALPIIMIRLYLGQFMTRLPTLLTPTRIAIVISIVVINSIGLSYFSQQPQHTAFALLDKKIETQEDQKKLLQQSDLIKTGLLNAYLARYRYLSTTGLSQRVKSNYQNTFGLKESAAIPQTLFNAFISPFLYQGENWDDIEKAEKYYTMFFDTPIQKAEREKIIEAVKHNWEHTIGNEAGLLDAANHYVHLKQQFIDIKEDSGIATVTLSQTLENITFQRQEAVIHFSLSEDAVLTGVWLSDNKIQPKKYPYVLAPKGAAQAVYKAEVNRRVDPALLEKVGPYQYRLRVYPVPAKTEGKKTQPMYMRLEYQTVVGKNKQWHLPKLLEKRNLFWDQKTEYFINAEVVEKEKMTPWFPEVLPAPTKQVTSLSYQQDNQHIVAVPRKSRQGTTVNKGKFAVLIDGSYSMNQHRQELLKITQSLGDNYSLYFCQQDCKRLSQPINLEKYSLFGHQQTSDHLAAFSQLSEANQYQSVFVLTDDGSYEIVVKTDTEAIKLTSPVWLVHLGDTVPYAYDDKVLDLLYQSKGGIAHSLEDALFRYDLGIRGLTHPCGNTSVLSITQETIWLAIDDPKENCQNEHNPALEKIATAQKIKHLIKTMDTKQLDNLDTIHHLAKSQGIVTHYSSMLVLINERQKKALKKAEEGDDRFDREIETGKQDTTKPQDPFALPSVPEPEEWALMIITGIFLTIALIRRRRLNS
ncbi:MAG: TIGR02921 family PEP-CTERM protein [Thiotrichaceae bacterium]|nr:TIGR02921 family PEP-CTERM protein [Thiotrichaceae bacterium]